MNKNRKDPMFEKYFNLKTPIIYLPDVKVQDKVEDSFKKSWSRFYKKADSIISEYRAERFEAFFRQLAKDGTDERYTRRVDIRYISKKVGYGVFAAENISPYSTLIHYTGLMMLDDEIDPSHDSTFSFSSFKKYAIDAAKHGNWARFMNHAPEGHATNNVIAWEYYTQKGPRIVFTAGSKGIKKGAQLLYSYGDEYWETKTCINL